LSFAVGACVATDRQRAFSAQLEEQTILQRNQKRRSEREERAKVPLHPPPNSLPPKNPKLKTKKTIHPPKNPKLKTKETTHLLKNPKIENQTKLTTHPKIENKKNYPPTQKPKIENKKNYLPAQKPKK